MVNASTKLSHAGAIFCREYPYQSSLVSVSSTGAGKNVALPLTVSLAVASISPSGLRSIALKGVLCAGMMLTLPVPISTI